MSRYKRKPVDAAPTPEAVFESHLAKATSNLEAARDK